MSPETVREMVRKRAKPSLREWCRVRKINSAHASEFMTGKRAPASDLLAALNLEYRIVRRATLAHGTASAGEAP